jgi:predicted nucleic acid-binding protein
LALEEQLPDGARLAFDTDAIIYFVEENAEFLSVVATAFELVARRTISAHVSTVSLAEVLVRPLRNGHDELAERYRQILTRGRNLTLHPVNAQVAERAASLRAQFNLETPDAMIAATALQAGCTHLLTNDGKYRAIPDIEVLVIREHAVEKGQL